MDGKRNILKSTIAWVLSVILLMPNIGAMAQNDSNATGLFMGELQLQDNDTVSLEDDIVWKKAVSDVDFVDGTATIELPSGLNMDEDRHTTLTDKSKAITVAAVSGTAVNINVSVQPMLMKNSASSSSVTVPIVGKALLAVPCKINPESVVNNTITINGTILNVRSSNTLPAYTMSLFSAKGSVDNWEPDKEITGSDKISLQDNLFIKLRWDKLDGVEANKRYLLDALPNAIGTPSASGFASFNTTAYPGANGVSKQFATMYWTSGSPVMEIEFDNMGTFDGNDILQMLGNVEMYYRCSLDKDNLVADDNGKVIITLPGGKNVTFTVTELVPKAPQLIKEVGSLDNFGVSEWTIVYTHPVTAYKGDRPDILEDKMPDGLDYVSGSATVTHNSGVAGTVTEPALGNDNTLSYQVPFDIGSGTEVTIKYKTRLSNDSLGKIWANTDNNKSFKYTNTVIAKKNNIEITTEGKRNIDLVVDKNWLGGFSIISKEAGSMVPTGNSTGNSWKIPWTVTVNTATSHFDTLYMIDTIGKGLDYIQNSIQVTCTDGIVFTPNGANVEFNSLSDGKDEMIIKLVDSGNPNPAAGTYTIKYETEIDQNYFDQNDPSNILLDSDISNAATLSYSWPTGMGPSNPPIPPTIEKSPGKGLEISNKLILKAKVSSYNRKNHSLKWNITVNPNKVNLTKATIVDNLKLDTKQAFTPNGTPDEELAVQQEIDTVIKSKLGTSSTTLTDDKLTITLNNLGTDKFTFEVTTYVTDPKIWAGNVNAEKFTNTVVMKEDETTVGGIRIKGDISASDTQNVTSNVLKKEAGTFDKDSKKLTWKFTVNENKTDIGNVEIEDTLPAGLSCNSVDATINSSPFAGNGTFKVENGTIKIFLDHVTDTKTITFQTTVDVNTDEFRTQETVTFKNTAKIESEANTEWVNSNEAKPILNNSVLSKNVVKPSGNKMSADYTVSLNPLGMNLQEGRPAGTKLQLTDTLPDGLYLDMDTIELWNATRTVAQSSGKYTVQLSKNTQVIQPVISYDSKENSFVVDIPDPEGSYLLTYSAYVVRSNVTLENDVELLGSAIPSSSVNQKATKSFHMDAFGSASFALPKNKFFSVQIKKVNERLQKLNGAEFGLYTSKDDANQLVKATCDATTGMATLAIPISQLAGATTLYWKEITPPIGYALNDEWNEISVSADNGAIKTLVNVEDVNQAAGKIVIKKVDKQGAALLGAKFILYSEEACTKIVQAETLTDNNGMITFDNLYPGRTYWLKETKAPDGYILPSKPIAVIASKAGEAPVTKNIENEKGTVTLTIHKVDREDNITPLLGAEYQLYSSPEGIDTLVGTKTTDAKGECTFQDLVSGISYYLKETKAPEGYIINDGTITITKIENDTNGKALNKTLTNYKKGWNERASIKLTKTDTSGSKLLKGAKFVLYQQDKNTIVSELITEETGDCTFTNLKAGTYYLKEIEAPMGYKLANSWTEVEVHQNTAETINIKNELISHSDNSSGSSSGTVPTPDDEEKIDKPKLPELNEEPKDPSIEEAEHKKPKKKPTKPTNDKKKKDEKIGNDSNSNNNNSKGENKSNSNTTDQNNSSSSSGKNGRNNANSSSEDGKNVSKSNGTSNRADGRLPQSGTFVDFILLTVLGVGLILMGIALRFRKKKVK